MVAEKEPLNPPKLRGNFCIVTIVAIGTIVKIGAIDTIEIKKADLGQPG